MAAHSIGIHKLGGSCRAAGKLWEELGTAGRSRVAAPGEFVQGVVENLRACENSLERERDLAGGHRGVGFLRMVVVGKA